MIRVEIKRDGTVTNAGEFETRELADAWLSKHEGLGTFGAKAHLSEEGLTEGYIVVIKDMTAELEQAKINEEAQAFLDSTDYKVLKYRDQVDMGLTPDLSVEEFQYLLVQRQQARTKIIK